MSLLNDIRAQSFRVRFGIFVLAVIASISIVGAWWFRTFRTDLTALLNDPSVAQEELEERDSASPFELLKEGIRDVRASIGDLFGNADFNARGDTSAQRATPRFLPLSNDRAGE